MKRTKRMAAMLLAAALLVTTSIAGTVAYLTSKTSDVVNTFTVGKVSFDEGAGLDEADVNEYGVAIPEAKRVTSNVYKLIPGHKYVKDPTVHMSAETEEAYLFVKVDNGIAAIEKASDENYKTIAAQMAANHWTALPGVENVYYYLNGENKTVKANQDIPVFGEFSIKGDAEVEKYANAKITIQAYAIQADGLADAPAAWKAAPLAAWKTIV